MQENQDGSAYGCDYGRDVGAGVGGVDYDYSYGYDYDYDYGRDHENYNDSDTLSQVTDSPIHSTDSATQTPPGNKSHS